MTSRRPVGSLGAASAAALLAMLGVFWSGSASAQGKLDATYSVTLGGVPVGKGTWSIDGTGQLCRHYDDPAPPNTPNPLCTPIEAHKVGDSWTMTMGGNSRTITLKAGIE